MIVNMYVDHMSTTQPQTAEDVWNETHVRSGIYADAAKKLGLTPKEYEEFRNALLDGKAIYVRLPKRLDGMAGYRNGQVYVVRKAVITTPNIMGWEVSLADGAHIYVPQLCGNLSVLRLPVVAHHVVPKPKHVYTVARRVAPPAPAATPAPVEVAIQPPAEVAPAPLTTVPTAVRGSQPWWLLLIPLPWLFNGGGNSPPPCSQGSNGQGVCQKA